MADYRSKAWLLVIIGGGEEDAWNNRFEKSIAQKETNDKFSCLCNVLATSGEYWVGTGGAFASPK